MQRTIDWCVTNYDFVTDREKCKRTIFMCFPACAEIGLYQVSKRSTKARCSCEKHFSTEFWRAFWFLQNGAVFICFFLVSVIVDSAACAKSAGYHDRRPDDQLSVRSIFPFCVGIDDAHSPPERVEDAIACIRLLQQKYVHDTCRNSPFICSDDRSRFYLGMLVPLIYIPLTARLGTNGMGGRAADRSAIT